MIPLLAATVAAAFPVPAPGEVPVPFARGVSRGGFDTDADGQHLARPAAGELQYWLGEPTVATGVVRARVVLGKKPDFTLLFRASQAQGDPFALQAYGVSVEQDELVLYRWELGGVRELGSRVAVEDLRDRRALEFVVQLTGPALSVTVWDGDTLAPLATLTATDGALPDGRVGWRVHPGQGADTELVALSILPVGPALPAEPTPFGDRRWIELPVADRARLPPELLGAIVVDDPNQLVLKTDPTGPDRLRRAGLTPIWTSADEPWWVRDPRYRATRTDPQSVVRDGIHLDQSYKNPEMTEALILAMARKHSDVARVAQLGESWQGRPIYGVRVSDNPAVDENEPVVLLVATHHGGELLAPEYALDALWRVLEDRDTDPRVARWVSELELWFVPLVNPDGNQAFLEQSCDSDRKNGRDLDGDGIRQPWEGVDLNRNYPFAWGALAEKGSSSIPASGKYRGPEQGSEPETKAIVRLADRRVPVAVLSWHTAANKILSPYTVDGKTAPAPDPSWAIAEELSAAAGRQPTGKPLAVARNLYAVDGTDQDWHRWAHGSVAYVVEGSHQNPKDPEIAAASIRTMRPVFEALLDRVLEGPRLVVQVRDTRGRPVSGRVTLDELVLSEGETWESRASDGRFDLMLEGDGPVTLHVDADGFQPYQHRVDVQGVTEVVVELKSVRGG